MFELFERTNKTQPYSSPLYSVVVQGTKAAEATVIAAAMCALLLAEKGRCLAAAHASSDSSQTEDTQPSASSRPASKGLKGSKAKVCSQQDSSSPELFWEQASVHAQLAIQAFAECSNVPESDQSADSTGGALDGMVSASDLMIELLFLMGLHGTYLALLRLCSWWHAQLISATHLLCDLSLQVTAGGIYVS